MLEILENTIDLYVSEYRENMAKLYKILWMIVTWHAAHINSIKVNIPL